MPTYKATDGFSDSVYEAASISDAWNQAIDWVQGGDWGDCGSRSVFVQLRVCNVDDESDDKQDTVIVDPPDPPKNDSFWP